MTVAKTKVNTTNEQNYNLNERMRTCANKRKMRASLVLHLKEKKRGFYDCLESTQRNHARRYRSA